MKEGCGGWSKGPSSTPNESSVLIYSCTASGYCKAETWLISALLLMVTFLASPRGKP